MLPGVFGLGYCVVGLRYVELGNPRGVLQLLLPTIIFFF